MLHGNFIIGPDSRCFTLTRARKIEMDALRQLVDHVTMHVVPHDAVRVIENAAHVTSHRCSIYVLARQDRCRDGKRGCLPPALRASPEDIFGKMKDSPKPVKVLK